MASRTIDVVVTANVRRCASLAARAKKYDVLLGIGLKPDEINAIPETIFNEMALECEPSFVDVRIGDQSFSEAVSDVLRKHLNLEMRSRGLRLDDVFGRS